MKINSCQISFLNNINKKVFMTEVIITYKHVTCYDFNFVTAVFCDRLVFF